MAQYKDRSALTKVRYVCSWNVSCHKNNARGGGGGVHWILSRRNLQCSVFLKPGGVHCISSRGCYIIQQKPGECTGSHPGRSSSIPLSLNTEETGGSALDPIQEEVAVFFVSGVVRRQLLTTNLVITYSI